MGTASWDWEDIEEERKADILDDMYNQPILTGMEGYMVTCVGCVKDWKCCEEYDIDCGRVEKVWEGDRVVNW